MRKAIIVFFLPLVLAAPVRAQDKIKIGYIDIQRAIVESQAGKKAREAFQTQVKRVEGDLLKEKQEIERLKMDYDKKGALLRDDEKRTMESDLDKRYVAYQRTMQDVQQDLRQKEAEMTRGILSDLEKVVTEVGKADNFTLILERSQVIYADQGVDITNKVIDLYNGRGATPPPAKATKSK